MDIIKKEHTTKKDNIAKATVTFIVRIQRKVFYYFVYLIAPCVLTAILATLIFYLPAASGERMVVGCTILLALSVFFLLATNYIPETSEHVPLVGRSVRCLIYTRKNAPVVTNLQQTCSYAVPTTCQQDVFALLVPNLLTSCQRFIDNLLQGFSAQQICHKLFQQLVIVLQLNNLSTSCQ
jgi:hypothetical protein